MLSLSILAYIIQIYMLYIIFIFRFRKCLSIYEL